MEMYNEFGLIKAKSFSEIKGKGEKSVETKSGTFGGLMWSLYKTGRFGNQGNVYQLGGAFIIDKEGSVLYQHVDKSSEDHVNIKNFLAEAGIKSNL